MRKFFITATDTDAGKTYVACALVKALTALNKKVAVYKPISAGCELINGNLVNEDAQLLTALANSGQSINEVNPIAYQAPIAPHIAAQQSKQLITVDDILTGYDKVNAHQADIVLTEGAGGWRLPLGQGHYLSDFVRETKQQIILVVNMKLGCLNHAILTYQAIIADGLTCVAWVANCPTTMDFLQENITELEHLLPVPRIATLGYSEDLNIPAQQLNLSVLLANHI
ncbi:dethiobiotin synthase [Colwelliaceae bacterium 6471]